MIEVKRLEETIPLDILSTENTDQATTLGRTSNGYVHPNGTVQNIGILKNASTYFSAEAVEQGWTLKAIPFTCKIKRFVILRDPFERYISGLAEDFFRYLDHNSSKHAFFQNLFNNNFYFDFFDFLFDAGVFNLADHTQLQYESLHLMLDEVGIENITFIKMSDKLGTNINLYLQGENCSSNFSNRKMHVNFGNNFYQALQYYFYDAKNNQRKTKLLKFLEPDYNLINSINFFNRH